MFGFGMPELVIILTIILVIFGAGKLPELGGALGKSLTNFKKGIQDKDATEINPKEEDRQRKEA
jgi:sec-independent protein translocase protein TatA